ncbi:MAG: hypothetical protein ACI9YT_001073 [Halobacteriales archaeon]|jgi:hypothetical protein
MWAFRDSLAGRTHDHIATVRSIVEDHPLAVLALVATVSQALGAWRVLARPGRPPTRDSRIFEFFGWRIARGDRLYLDLWEVKPPLSFEITAALAWLSGGDVWTYHLLCVAVTGLAAVGSVVLVGAHVRDLTDDGVAAAAAGLAMYVVVAFHLRAGYGFKPKYFVALAALAAVWLVRRDRPFAGGLAAAAAVGFWQVAAVVPVLALGVAAQRGSKRTAARVLVGGAVGAGAMLAPIVYWGASRAMLAQVVAVPLTAVPGGDPIVHLRKFPRYVAVGDGPFLAGVVGVAWIGLRRDRARAWWAAVGGAWFLAVALFFDFDLAPDLFPALAFVAVALGLLLAAVDVRVRRVLVAWTVFALVVNVALMGWLPPFGGPVGITDSPDLADREAIDAPYNASERKALLWYDVEPTTCHVFVAKTEATWIERTGGNRTASTCQEWPVGNRSGG